MCVVQLRGDVKLCRSCSIHYTMENTCQNILVHLSVTCLQPIELTLKELKPRNMLPICYTAQVQSGIPVPIHRPRSSSCGPQSDLET